MDKFILSHIKKSIETKTKLLEEKELIEQIKTIACVFTTSLRNGGKILIAGNGGSAADAQHIAGELVSRFYFDRPGLPAVALTTDSSILTAIGNDYGFDRVFARQIQANGRKGDAFLGISTSGNSKNVMAALEECKRMEIASIGFTGSKGGAMAELCDFCLKVPADETPTIQESHIMIGHIVCSIIEEELFGKGFK